jgi:hypothetical protein
MKTKKVRRFMLAFEDWNLESERIVSAIGE